MLISVVSYNIHKGIGGDGRLDRIMTDSGIDIIDFGVQHSALARAASGHLPVWAKLRMPPRE